MWERIKHILKKEFIQIRRDKRMVFVIFVAPLIQLLVLGYVVTTDVNHIPTAIFDQDLSQKSREIISLFKNSGYFDIVSWIENEKEAKGILDKGKATFLIQIPSGFSKDLKKGETAEIQIILDGTNSNTAGVILNYTNQIFSSYSQKMIKERISKVRGAFYTFQPQIMGVKLASVDPEVRAWYNPELKSRDFNVPAVIALILLVTTIMLTSMAVVREKEIGTIEQLIVTPIRPAELLVGKIIPFALIGFFEVFLITFFTIFWFKIPLKGNFLLLLFTTGLYLFTTLGIGLLISTLSKTQQQAMMSTFFFIMPAIILSGFMFPISNMPKIIQYLTYLNPLRYFLVIIRGIFLKGVGLRILWNQMIPLGIIGVAVLSLSILRFRKRIE
jgi:ABC-2 type transport system permease protein